MKDIAKNAVSAAHSHTDAGRLERRACQRFTSDFDARLFYGNLIYTGRVTDISRNGMFIKTNVGFPVDSEIIVIALIKGSAVRIPIKVRRRAGENTGNVSQNKNGIGVELMHSPSGYTEYISGCRDSDVA